MLGSSSRARNQVHLSATELGQLDAMARLAREANLVVHVVQPRAPGVVEHAREIATQFGLECYADLRGGSIRVRFMP